MMHNYAVLDQMKDWLWDASLSDDKENTKNLFNLASTAALIVIAEELQKGNQRAELEVKRQE